MAVFSVALSGHLTSCEHHDLRGRDVSPRGKDVTIASPFTFPDDWSTDRKRENGAVILDLEMEAM
jgi:hypothetical protein